MREACAVAATVLHRLKALVQPGISTFDLEQAGRDLIAGVGGRSADFGYQIGSRRFPAHTCLSVNEEVVHGIGSLKRILREEAWDHLVDTATKSLREFKPKRRSR